MTDQLYYVLGMVLGAVIVLVILALTFFLTKKTRAGKWRAQQV